MKPCFQQLTLGLLMLGNVNASAALLYVNLNSAASLLRML